MSIEQLAINTIRTLSMDGVQKANSGHPGTPMALAPVVYQLWQEFMRYDPCHPNWPARDRFVLSCGHASMLLFSVLHLAGIRKSDGAESLAITLEDLKNFRQLHSPCAGHPEYREAAGIEVTTGPLGQGIATSVGMAIGAKWMAARYDRPGYEMFEFDVFALCSDGDLMEGVGCEAASIAGHLKLSNLCWIYDDNRITIEGETELAFSEDVGRRFEGLGWNVVHVADANDLTALAEGFRAFLNTTDRPTLIIVRSVIGYGSPNKANTHGAHGAPLGEEEVRKTKQVYGWPADANFLVPDEVRAHFAAGIGKRGGAIRAGWVERFAAYTSHYPELSAELQAIWSGQRPMNWEHGIPTFPADAKGLATRVSSGKVINSLARSFPWFLGGSADLAPSTMTLIEAPEAGHFSGEHYSGRNFHFGIREHGMAAACNGMALVGLRPYGATFFVFSDYLRPAMRLSALMRLGVTYVFTHDSIGLGEDGPTHQPVEHLAACRAIPGLIVARPGDANEVSEIYRAVLSIHDRPSALVLSRQNVPTLDRTRYAPATGAAQGAYVLAETSSNPRAILIGTGSELAICVAAYESLAVAGMAVRLVSMPSWELFELQPAEYRAQVLPAGITARVAVEAGIQQGWERYLGPQGRFVGMSTFGASAPAGVLYKHFGLTAERVAAEVKAALELSSN
ncbi:MAG: transketolase [Planctomycetes bacterium]|nr:transketolase [Planctomycetota bacterium]